MTVSRPTNLTPRATIREAMSAIDLSSEKIALVLDAEGRLIGTVTDGDVRRGILRGINLDETVERVMNAKPTVAKAGQSQQAVFAQMRRDRFRQMPVVDEAGRVVRVEVLSDLLLQEKRGNVVVVMAGGLGARLQHLTADRPKPLLMVGNKPILESIVETFVESGFTRFYISVNYKREMVEHHFGDGSKWGISIDYLREDKALGTAGALSLLPERPTHPIVMMNGDILTNVNFDHLLAYHGERGAAATVAVREYGMQVPYGVIDVDDDRMTGIREKPIFQILVNAGIYVLEPEILDLIPKAERFDMPQVFHALLEAKRPVSVFPVREYWIDIGQMEDFTRANGEFDRVFR